MAGWQDAPIVGNRPSGGSRWQDAPVVGNDTAQPVTADTLRQAITEQIARENPPETQPQVEGNQFASSLPGPLGQLQNSSRAFHGGMIEGLTGNLSNEITSGVLAPVVAAGDAIQGKGFDVGRSFNDVYQFGNDMAQGSAALNPRVSNMGNLTGAAALGSALGPLSATTRATTPLGMAATGALEGGIYGGIYGAGGAEGNERWLEGAKGAGAGALAGGVIGGTASGLMPQVSQEARILNRGMSADGIAPGSVASRLAALGPDGIVADLGPSLQGQAAAIATLPGQGSRKIVDALKSRRELANERIRVGVEDALGTAPRLSEVTGAIDAERKAINTQYEPVFRAKALSDDPFTDITPVVNALDTRIGQTVGGTQSTLRQVRSLLTGPNGKPIADPQMVMAVRQELDGMIGAETNRTVQSALKEIRRELDNTLGSSVPGLKDVDAQFSEAAKQADAVDRGRTVLRTDQNAIDPADLVEEMAANSAGVNLRLSEGTRAEINRILGTNANDRVKLRDIVRGEGSWNAQKLETVLGKERADQLMAIIDREAKFAELENLATSGSRTQVLKAAQDDIQGRVNDPGIIREALNFQYGNAAGKVADRLLGGLISRNREGVVNNVADALLGKGLTPKMQSEVQRLIDGMTPNEKAIIAALQASQANSR